MNSFKFVITFDFLNIIKIPFIIISVLIIIIIILTFILVNKELKKNLKEDV